MSFNPQHYMVGPVVVNFASDDLGYSEDGIGITFQPFYDNIASDDFGGRAGPPADAQLLGVIATIDISLTKYEKAEVDQLIASFRSNGQNGISPPVGSFVRQDVLGGILLLKGINEHLSFPFAYLKRNQEINSGTKWRRYTLGFEAWQNQTDYAATTHLNKTLFTTSTQGPLTTTTSA